MFAVLQTDSSKSLFSRSKIESQRITLPSGEAFFIVNISCRKGKVPWKKLERCLGILKEDVILTGETKIPDNSGITAFKPDILPGLLLMNSAIDHILESTSSFYGSLTVFDEKGIYQSYIEKLINSFSSVKIITPFQEKYQDVSHKLLKDYGFSLIVSSEEKYNSDTVISHSCTVPLYFKGRIYTNERKYLMNAEIFTGKNIELPEEYEKLRPQNIGRVQFASALFEKCGVRDIGSLSYSDFDC